MDKSSLIVEIALVCVIIAQQVMHWFERRDLYNRIMAKDLKEYKSPEAKTRPIKNAIRKRINELKEAGKM